MTVPPRSSALSWRGDVATVVVSVGVAAVLSLAYHAMAGRLLGPAAYSDFAGAVALAALLAIALGALTPITSILSARYIAAGEPARVRGLTNQLVRIALAAGAVVVLVSLVAGPAVARALQFRSATVVIAAAVVYLGIAASNVVRAAMRGSQRFAEYGRNVIAETAIRLAAGVTFLVLTKSAALAVAAFAVATLVTTISGLGVIRRVSPEVQAADLRDVTSILGPTVVLSAAMAVYQNADVLLVKRFFDPAAAGLYGSAAVLARTMAVVLMPLEALLLPRLTYLLERRERAIGPILSLLALFVAIAAVPLLLFAIAPDLVMTALYGRAYADAASLLLPLGGAMFLLFLAYLGGQVLISIGREGLAYVFSALVIVEVTVVVLFHQSLLTVAVILLASRSAGLAIIVLGLLRGRER